MKTSIIAVCSIVFAFSSPAVQTQFNFSGIVTEADSMSVRNGFEVGRIFTGYFSYDPEAWNANTIPWDRGTPRLGIDDSPYRTSGNLDRLTLRIGADYDIISFIGEMELMNMLSINLVDRSRYALNGSGALGDIHLADWSLGEIVSSGNADFNLGAWRGLLVIPRIGLASPSQVPEPGSTALLLTLATVVVVLKSLRVQPTEAIDQ